MIIFLEKKLILKKNKRYNINSTTIYEITFLIFRIKPLNIRSKQTLRDIFSLF